MMYVEARTYGSAAEMLESARARRERLFGKPRRDTPVANVEPVATVTAVSARIRPDLYHDAHVRAWRAYDRERIDAAVSPVRSYVLRRSFELGFSYREIVGPQRHRSLADARFRIIWEIKTFVKPHVSYPELGRIFRRDHTTILHAYRTYDAKMQEAAP